MMMLLRRCQPMLIRRHFDAIFQFADAAAATLFRCC